MTPEEIKHRMAWLRQESSDGGCRTEYPDTAAEIDEIERLALSALERTPPEVAPSAWVATHVSGALAHFSKEDGWQVEAVQTTPSPLVDKSGG